MKKYYRDNDVIGKYLKDQRHKHVLPIVKGKLLDIACGENALVDLYGEGMGIDIVDFGANMVVQDYKELPFGPCSFDTITILASLNYFEEPEKVLMEIHRVLRNDGQLVISNSNHYVMKWWHLFRERWAHRSGISLKELKKILAKNGFVIHSRIWFNFYLSYVLVLRKV